MSYVVFQSPVQQPGPQHGAGRVHSVNLLDDGSAQVSYSLGTEVETTDDSGNTVKSYNQQQSGGLKVASDESDVSRLKNPTLQSGETYADAAFREAQAILVERGRFNSIAS